MLKTWEAAITSGGKFKAKYVIHTVGPVWHGGDTNEETLLVLCESKMNCSQQLYHVLDQT